jgi:hypothetical protein
VALEQGVDGHGDRAERERRVVDPRKVGHVRNEHGDPVAGADATGTEGTGVGQRLLPELGVGGRGGPDDHGDVVGVAGGRLREDGRDRRGGVASGAGC